MCVKCNRTGSVYQVVMPGAYTIAPCGCEYSMQQRQALEQELQILRKRLAIARAQFSANGKTT